MRVLVTGGSGFLGSHIADEAFLRGHEVRIFDDTASPWLLEGQQEILGDVLDRAALCEALQDCDVVFHCAAIADLYAARQNPRRAIEVNVVGTLSAMEAAARAGVRRFMYASSVYVYSRSGSIYRTTKQAAENIVRDLSPDLGLEPTILRYGSLYGPRADPDNAIFRLVKMAVSERKIDFWGDGKEVREYIHIRDAAALSVDAISSEFSGVAVHITGRERLTTEEVIDVICETLGGGITVSYSDENFEGRYRSTPYSHTPDIGRRLVGNTYIDLGLGLLEQIQSVSDVAIGEG